MRMCLLFSFITALIGTMAHAAKVEQVNLSPYHALSVDTGEWNAAETRLLGNRDFLFEHRKLASLRGVARTELMPSSKSADDYLKELCSLRSGQLDVVGPLHRCTLPNAAENVMQFLTVSRAPANRVAVDSLTFVIPSHFSRQARLRVEELVKSWSARHE